jgi:hypothetical protein
MVDGGVAWFDGERERELAHARAVGGMIYGFGGPTSFIKSSTSLLEALRHPLGHDITPKRGFSFCKFEF